MPDTTGRRTLLASGLVALAALILYLLTMPPGVTWWFGAADSGDLAAAAYELGVPHPSGYPLFVSLGWLVTRLPFGEPAGRLNAMDAVFGAAAALVAGWTVWEAARDTAARRWAPLAGAASAAALATSGLLWSQAIVTEVYALNLLLCAVVGALALRAAAGRGQPLLLGLAQGLALSDHLTSVFALVATAGALAAARRRPATPELARFAAGLVMGLSLYALLPIRAAQGPASNWGDPDSLDRFLRHVTGRDYGGNLALADPAGVLVRAVRLLRLLLGDVALWAIPAAGYGLAWAWHNARALAVYSLALGVLSLAFAGLYRVPDYAVYLLPAYFGYCLLAGAGLLAAGEALAALPAGRSRPLALAGVAVVAALCGGWAARGFLAQDLHGDRTPRLFAEAVLGALPEGGAFPTARDDVTFTLWYAQRALGLRQDVAVIDVRFPGAADELRRRAPSVAARLATPSDGQPQNRRARAGAGGGEARLGDVRLLLPAASSGGDGFLALGIGGVPLPGDGVVVSVSPSPQGPLIVEFAGSPTAGGAPRGQGPAAQMVDVGTGRASGCAPGDGRLRCAVAGPGIFLLVSGDTVAPPPLDSETRTQPAGRRATAGIAGVLFGALVGGVMFALAENKRGGAPRPRHEP